MLRRAYTTTLTLAVTAICAASACERSPSQLQPFDPPSQADEEATAEEQPAALEQAPNRAGASMLEGSLSTLDDGWSEHQVVVDGTPRVAAIYRPIEQTQARVYFFHGYGHNAVAMARGMAVTRFAERYKAELVFAEGLENEVSNDGGRRSWNAGACCAFDHPERDDVGFVRALDAELRTEFGDLPTYGIGFSNGGFLVEMIACQHPDIFAAVTSVAGSISEAVLPCAEDRSSPVRVQRIAGSDDERVPLAGGEERGRDYLSYDADKALWYETLGCGDAMSMSNVGFTECETRRCDHGAMRFCLVQGMGHNWPTLNGRWHFDALADAWRFWTVE